MRTVLLTALLLSLVRCADPPAPTPVTPTDTTVAARAALQRHLTAIENKDLTALRATLSPTGEMRLILPGAEIMETADSFLQFHTEWFADTSWSMDTRIVALHSGPELASAVTELMYREPERDGVPYFNRMQVTYVLRREGNDWFVIQDHASSTEKSTD